MKRSRHGTVIGLAAGALCCITLSLMVISPGCGKDTTVSPRSGIPMGHLEDYSTCKSGSSSLDPGAPAENQDCATYELGGDGTLALRHVNAAFNCCPTDFLAEITIRDDTITIVERDSLANPCRCMCLYDLDYKFENIEAGTYTFVFVEPYTNESDPPLVFTAELVPGTPGSFCVGRDHDPWNETGTTLTGTLTSHTDCKTGTLASTPGSSATNLDCIEYRRVADNTFVFKHTNAAFNCCPDDLEADIIVRNDTVTVIEREVLSNPCFCLCLYDLEYRFENMAPGRYTFVFIEPYAPAGDPPLVFTADLAALPSGSYCVERSGYPWSRGSGTEPVGALVSHSDCTSNAAALAADKIPGDLDCAEYHYGAAGTLALTHLNAAFNCCPGAITADVEVADGVITIVEHEVSSMCDCSCLYDLDYEITNLPPALYMVRIIGVYLQPGEQPLEFPMDLSAIPDGFVGRYRSHYPWGHLGTMAADKLVLDRMRREIIDFIGTPSCGGSGDCLCIPLGVKPCGGPWEYLVYSAATIDVNTLAFMVARYDAFNDGFNQRYNIASDCMLVMPPRVGCVGGLCKALDATGR